MAIKAKSKKKSSHTVTGNSRPLLVDVCSSALQEKKRKKDNKHKSHISTKRLINFTADLRTNICIYREKIQVLTELELRSVEEIIIVFFWSGNDQTFLFVLHLRQKPVKV